MKINNTKINFNNYFSKMQDYEQMLNWTGDQLLGEFFELFSAHNPVKNPTTLDLVPLFKNKIIGNIKLNNFSSLFDDSKPNESNLTFKYQNYEYLLNKWVPKENDFFTKEFKYPFLDKSVNVPNYYNALEYASNNKLIVDQSYFSNFYASGLYAAIIKEPFLVSSFVSIEEDFFKKYFSENSNDKNYLEIQGEASANGVYDLEEKFDLNIDFRLPNYSPYSMGHKNSNFYNKTLQLTNFLSLNNYLISNSDEKSNLIFINNSTSFRRRVANSIKSILDKKTFDDLPLDSDIQLNTNPITIQPNVNSYYLYRGNVDENILGIYNTNLLGLGTFSFLNKTFTESSMNLVTNEYFTKRNKSESFVIDYLSLNVDLSSKPIIKKSSTSFYYLVKSNYGISLLNGEHYINNYYFINFLYSEFPW